MTSRESAAPLAARPESSSAPCVYPSLRLHRRGCRSAGARLRRVEAWRASCERSCDTMVDEGEDTAINGSEGLVVEEETAQEIGGDPSIRRSSQSGPSTPFIQDTFSVFHLNPQGISRERKRAEFDALIQHVQQPSVVAITETWLSKSMTAVTLTGYTPVSRLDRRVGRPDRGGIAVFVRDDFRDKIVHIADSPIDERSWHIIHCDFGPVLLCVWYRQPARGETDSIRRFAVELDSYSQDSVADLQLGISMFTTSSGSPCPMEQIPKAANWNMSATNAV